MELRFGTDGVRGRAYQELTLDGAARIGRAVARLFGPDILIGADTRVSGPDLVGALGAGIVAEGAIAPVWLGITPTPAVAFASVEANLPAIMVSASHNVWTDNGIKVFAPGGRKLSDDQQHTLEAAIDAAALVESAPLSLGELVDGQAINGRWQAALAGTVRAGALAGIHVVVDAANGAASAVSGPVLANAGARVDLVAATPDGRNINEGCGSTHPEFLAAEVVARGADVGVAFDGDADRIVAVDHLGGIVDGDALIALLATRLAHQGRLVDKTVVVTTMTNLGFDRAMAQAGIAVERVGVGDRHVFAALDSNGWVFGGEQSGHLIFREFATTGDGTLAAIQLLDLIVTSTTPLCELARDAMTALPQVRKNIPVATSARDVQVEMAEVIDAAESELGADGRILVRASGTEPVVRVMVEAVDAGVAQRVCDEVSGAVVERYGA